MSNYTRELLKQDIAGYVIDKLSDLEEFFKENGHKFDDISDIHYYILEESRTNRCIDIYYEEVKKWICKYYDALGEIFEYYQDNTGQTINIFDDPYIFQLMTYDYFIYEILQDVELDPSRFWQDAHYKEVYKRVNEIA